ncbi:MAG: N-acetylmuramoyl-L-alanine amidase, partial [Deltaproteobacteria bacterium]|nr:N-acetylmuramoyl-L-alanine amidase [Deltaproteobacteria bacterium]
EVSSSIYDRQEAIDYLNRLLKRFPKSPHRPEAERVIDELRKHDKVMRGKARTSRKMRTAVTALKTSEVSKAKGGAATPPQSLAEVNAIRFWSSPTYARVVIDVEPEVVYSHRLLKGDPATSGPDRLLIDLTDARVGPGVKPFLPTEGTLLADARATQHRPDTVRVVVDLKSIDHVRVFSLPNPFRILVDVRSVPVKTASKKRVEQGQEKSASKLPEGALAKQLALGVRKIVIDPGHGGDDFGATGYLKGVFEKNVALEVSQRLAKRIRERLGCEAILTREDDRRLSLEQRTAFANTVGADLFISIHTNAHKKMASYGTETYFLNLATDEDAILLAARENAASANSISDLEGILTDLMTQTKQEESSRLARHVQDALVRTLNAKFGKIKDKGVKQAPFYVLLGADMPCILVEVAFITNPRECRRLNTTAYQDAVADAIVTGIEAYVKEMRSPTITEAKVGNAG